MEYSYETQVETLSSFAGGRDLVSRCGDNVGFHDAVVVSLQFDTRCTLKVLAWPFEESLAAGRAVRTFIATFVLDGVMDIELSNFAPDCNILFGLHFRRAPPRPDRQAWYGLRPSAEDVEIELEPSVGLGGFICCQMVSVSYEDVDENQAARAPRGPAQGLT